MQIKSISYKLVFMILLVSSVATFIFTVFSYYRDFQKDMNTLNLIVNEVSKSYKKSLSRALFSYDDEQIQTQLKGILALPDVTHLQIVDPTGEVLYSLKKEVAPQHELNLKWYYKYLPENFITQKVPLNYKFEGNNVDLGIFYYTATTKNVYSTLVGRGLYFLFSQGIKTLAITIVFLIVVHLLITKHLIKITRHVSKLNPSRLEHADILELDRPDMPHMADELDILVNKINELKSALNIRNQQNERLIVMAEDEAENHKRFAITAAKLASIGELAGGIAHEINNPLSIISGYASMLTHVTGKSEKDEATISKVSEQISKTIERISSITSSMLKYSRQDTKLQLLDLKDIISEVEVIAISKVKESSSEIRVTEIKKPQDGYYIYGNKVQVGQVLINLINNAVDAMEDNNVNIAERVINVELDFGEEYVTLNLINPGPPIPEEVQENMLQPFFTTKPEGKGTGLGLSICTTIMDSHNGSFSLVPTKEGAFFQVRFPRPGIKYLPA
jgi:signal transduction histidine kinase